MFLLLFLSCLVSAYEELELPSSVLAQLISSSKVPVSIKHEDERGFLHVDYDVELTDVPILNLDHLDAPYELAKCGLDGSHVVLHRRHSSSPRRRSDILVQSGHYIVGGHHWRCPTSFGGAGRGGASLVRKALYVRALNDTHLHVKTQPASPFDLIRNGRISINTNRFRRHDTALAADRKAPVKFTRRSFLGDIFSTLVSVFVAAIELPFKVLHYAGAFIEYAKAAMDLAERAAYGPKVLWTKSFAFNYDEHSKAALMPSIELSSSDQYNVSCVDCYFYLNMELRVSILVSDYTLSQLRLIAHADDGAINLNGSLSAAYEAHYAYEFPIWNFTTPAMTFPIMGIPFTFHFNAPVIFRVDASLSAKLNLWAAVHTSIDSWDRGIYYQNVDGKVSWRWVIGDDFEHTPAFSLDASVRAALTLGLEFIPTLMMDFVGGPYMSIKPFIGFSAQSHLSSPMVVDANFSLNAGYQFGMGVDINILNFWKKKYGPVTLKTGTKTLESGSTTWKLGSDNLLARSLPVKSGPPIEGNCWNGDYEDHKHTWRFCNSVLRVSGAGNPSTTDLSLHYYGNNTWLLDFTLPFAGGVDGGTPIFCEMSIMYVGWYTTPGKVLRLRPAGWDKFTDVQISQCKDDDGVSYQPPISTEDALGWEVQFIDATYDTVMVISCDNCFKFCFNRNGAKTDCPLYDGEASC